MNPLIQLKATPPLLIALGLLGFALSPTAQAVVPPPDGGYPNFTTAEGTNALQSLTTGAANTAVGWHSLFSNAEGSFNTATGAGALLLNTANENTAFGAAALLFNTAGFQNTAVGAAALLNNNGFSVDAPNGGPGSANTAIGARALNSNTTGGANTGSGAQALQNNITGGANTAIGAFALFQNTQGNVNTAVGNSALGNNIDGNNNTAIGSSALINNADGQGNTALGYGAGLAITHADDVIAIGAAGEDVSNTCYIGNIFGVTSAGATAVYVNPLGKLGTVISSRRFKEEIQPMDKASEAILALKPVSFRYKQEIDPVRSPQFGLVAEDVEKVDPALVVRDTEGKVNTVRYEAVNAMLLNEFLKEHRKNEEQQAIIAELRKAIARLTARDEEQAAQIQKVSAQVQMSKLPAQVVANKP